MNDLDLLRGWRANAAEPDAETLAGARERLLAEAAREPARRTGPRRQQLLLAGALGAAVALTAGVVVTQQHTPEIDTRAQSARQLKMVSVGVAKLLGDGADSVTQQPVAPPRAGQWIYEKRLASVGTADGLSLETVEMWLSADGTKMKHSNLPNVVDVNGNRLTDENGVMPAGLEGDDQSPLASYAQLTSWPSDPASLLARASGGDLTTEQGRDRAFQQLTAALTDAPFVPAAQHAAIFRALAQLPGVQMQAAEDIAGRRGIAVGRQDPHEGHGGTRGLRYEIIIDEDTYQYLGQRMVALGEVPTGVAHDGNILNASARLETGVVDGPNARP